MLSRAILIHKEIYLKVKIFVWLCASLLFLLPVLENCKFSLEAVAGLWLSIPVFSVSQDT